jgi:hypothetical protein
VSSSLPASSTRAMARPSVPDLPTRTETAGSAVRLRTQSARSRPPASRYSVDRDGAAANQISMV